MTIIEAIISVDAITPNTYTQGEKIRWLSNLDGNIKAEIIDTHEGHEAVEFEGYTEITPIDTVLLIPSPYDDIYTSWLQMQIDYANGEFNKFNNSSAIYNSRYAAFERYYNRTHMPLTKHTTKYF